MTRVTIYHNPRCSKSRQTLELLREKGIEPEIVDYLTTPPSAETLRELLALLQLTPLEFIRHKESEFVDSGLDQPDVGDATLIEAMVRNPRLIERPIVIANGKAAIGRPPERILEIL